MVRRITPVQATPDGVQYDLDLVSGLAGFQRAVGQSDVLVGVGDDYEGDNPPTSTSTYRLR